MSICFELHIELATKVHLQRQADYIEKGFLLLKFDCLIIGRQLFGRVPLGQGLRGSWNRSKIVVIQHGPNSGMVVQLVGIGVYLTFLLYSWTQLNH